MFFYFYFFAATALKTYSLHCSGCLRFNNTETMQTIRFHCRAVKKTKNKQTNNVKITPI